MFKQLSLILQSSSKITVDPEHRRTKLSPLKYGPLLGRSLYFSMALLNSKDIFRMDQKTQSHFKHLIEAHPEAIPSIFWPYQCISWDTSDRVNYLYNHFMTLPELRHQIDYLANHQCSLVDADNIYPRLRIVIDKNDLFMREGMITLNLFTGHERIFTLAFSLYKNNANQICAIAGAIQGRRMDGITDLYRDMTKRTYGIRPRDLMIEAFQTLCRSLGVKKIYAVTESHRQHRHHFYCLNNKQNQPSLNYDEVWSDRSGIRCNSTFFELPLDPVRKPLTHIISRKRSMYRNRYSLLEGLEQAIEQGLSILGSLALHEHNYNKPDIQYAD
ncbi:MAG: VirK/YbjX family protein [Candidatus Thiodiazotropha endolucinida]|nr:VirK/YbjX family protein [Candidatus Thiodiazotropha endolucinida]